MTSIQTLSLAFRRAALPASVALYCLMGTAGAQTPDAAATPASAPAAAAPAASAPAAPVATYAPSELERAFKFMDGDGDGKVTRDEAAKFRNVAKHFDAADTNKDNVLSREEFDNAMNRSKAP